MISTTFLIFRFVFIFFLFLHFSISYCWLRNTAQKYNNNNNNNYNNNRISCAKLSKKMTRYFICHWQDTIPIIADISRYNFDISTHLYDGRMIGTKRRCYRMAGWFIILFTSRGRCGVTSAQTNTAEDPPLTSETKVHQNYTSHERI